MGIALCLRPEKYVSGHSSSVSVCQLSLVFFLPNLLFRFFSLTWKIHMSARWILLDFLHRWLIDENTWQKNIVWEIVCGILFLLGWGPDFQQRLPSSSLQPWMGCWCLCFNSFYSLLTLASFVLRAVIASFISSSLTDVEPFLTLLLYFASSCPER